MSKRKKEGGWGNDSIPFSPSYHSLRPSDATIILLEKIRNKNTSIATKAILVRQREGERVNEQWAPYVFFKF